jgi:pimeloyl-ACP methyl ester carboxylesterase
MAKIIYSESGQGFPVIFLHGFGESKELWQMFQAHLSTKYRTIAPDLPGFGQSPLFNNELTLEDVAEKLHEWTSEIGVKECIMIGHSLGGYITLAFANKYPEMMKGLGLFHSSVFADTPEKKENRKKTIEFIKQNGAAAFIENFIPPLFYEESHLRLAEIIKKQVDIGKNTPANTLTAYLAAMAARPDSSEFIKNFDKPVLMIIGEKDSAVPFDKSMEQTDMLLQPDVHVLDLTGHMGMFERERETLIYVETFVDKVAVDNASEKHD